MLDTNLRAVIPGWSSTRPVGACSAERWGRLVLKWVSSSAAFTGSPGQTNYPAAKAGLVLRPSPAWELGPRGITVNVVAPGLIATDMTRDSPPTPGGEQFPAERTPLDAPGRAEEVAAAVSPGESAEAGDVTGAVLPVGGGLGMGI